MKKKLNEITSTWDWKSIQNMIIIIALFGVILWKIDFGGGNEYSKKLNQLESTTKGIILNVEAKNTITHSRDGARELLLGYNISFEYRVRGNNYRNNIFLKAGQRQCREFRKNYFINKRREFEVKYNSSSPRESLINL